MATELLSQHCRHRTDALPDAEVARLLGELDGWTLVDGFISRQFAFRNYHETLAFVNGIAYVIHAEDHHPELVVGYNRCTVKFNTHSVNNGRGGLSENDFICAAKIDALARLSFAAASAGA